MAERELSAINQALSAAPHDCIRAAETRYHDAITALADQLIADGRRHVLLLAGPSSSGKTTTANILADRFRTLGHLCDVLSLDNFYRDKADPAYPRLPNGERDLECVPGKVLRLAHTRVLAHEDRPIHRDGRVGHDGKARRVDDDAREAVESEALDVSSRLEALGDCAEIRLVASDELSQRCDVYLLSALHAPVQVR